MGRGGPSRFGSPVPPALWFLVFGSRRAGWACGVAWPGRLVSGVLLSKPFGPTFLSIVFLLDDSRGTRAEKRENVLFARTVLFPAPRASSRRTH